jgi:2-C-methyl-D-erythritol 4-phosphate cytidylyltransferase
MQVCLIIPAAGVGKRFAPAAAGGAEKRKGPASKIEIDLCGKPVFLRAIDAFRQCPPEEAGVGNSGETSGAGRTCGGTCGGTSGGASGGGGEVVQTLLAVNPEALESFKFKWGDRLALLGVDIVPGGRKERWETVLAALGHVAAGVTHIAIHDAARPLVSPTLIARVFAAAAKFAAVIPAVPVNGTLKRVATHDEDNLVAADPLDAILGGPTPRDPHDQVHRVQATVDRTGLYEVQTPQVFERGLLERAYAQITAGVIDGNGVTDDAMLVERLGEAVRVVEGEAMNLKITRPPDVELATAWLTHQRSNAAAVQAKRKLFGDEEE